MTLTQVIPIDVDSNFKTGTLIFLARLVEEYMTAPQLSPFAANLDIGFIGTPRMSRRTFAQLSLRGDLQYVATTQQLKVAWSTDTPHSVRIS